MFSSGNVTERRRMGEIQTKDEVIVDAFCGIGYYTIPFLVRGLAKHVHACEINPNSIIALRKGWSVTESARDAQSTKVITKSQ